MRSSFVKIVLFVLIAALPLAIAAQTTKRKTTKKPATKKTTVSPTPQPSPEPTPELPPKKNEREADGNTNSREGSSTSAPQTYKPVYVYTFDRPGFVYSNLKIEHDDTGKGRIWFKKDSFDPDSSGLDDPIDLSQPTLDQLKQHSPR